MFDEHGKIKKYKTIDEIINDFCVIRYQYYTKRKAYLIKMIENDLLIFQNKYRFLEEVMNETLILKDVDENQITETMKKTGYHIVEGDESFGYLLGLHIRSFSKQKLEEIKKNIEKLKVDFEKIKKTTEKEMWKIDLDQFMKEYENKN